MIDALIIGGDSLIGRALYRHLTSAGKSVVATSRRTAADASGSMYFDLSKPVDIDLPSQMVIMCAGITDLKRCESDPSGTRRINVDATLSVFEAAHAAGSRVIYLSSHAVFDGALPMLPVDAPASAIIEYGRQKAEVERGVLAFGPRASVVRMTKVMSCRVPLVSKWISALERLETITPFEDLVMSPISLRYLVSLITDPRLEGIVHASSAMQLTYAEFATDFVKALGFSAGLVRPVNSKDAGIDLLYHPRFTTLAMVETEARFGVGPQKLESVLTDLAREYVPDRAK